VSSKPERLHSEGTMSATETTSELLTVNDVAKLLSAGRRTICRWAQIGRMPEPVKLGRRCVRWRRADLLDWIDRGCPSCIEGGEA